MVYNKLRQFEEAKLCYLRAIKGCEAIFGYDSRTTLATVNNLACLYQDIRDYQQAGILLQRVFDGYMKLLGDRHANVFIVATNLGSVKLNLRDFIGAKELFQFVLNGRLAVFGELHDYSFNAMNNLARAHKLCGDVEAMTSLLERVVVGKSVRYGPSHEATLHEIVSLAEAQRSVKLYVEAIGNYGKAVVLRESLRDSIVDRDSQEFLSAVCEVVVVLVKRGFAYGDQGDIANAVATFQDALGMCVSSLGDDANYSQQVSSYLRMYSKALEMVNGGVLTTANAEIRHAVHPHLLGLTGWDAGMFNCDNCQCSGIGVRYACRLQQQPLQQQQCRDNDGTEEGFEQLVSCDCDVCLECSLDCQR